MGDDEHSSLVVQKIILKPSDRSHIQMVCGLVQDDEIGCVPLSRGKAMMSPRI